MKLDNGIISVQISEHGAELKSVLKDGVEYMWCADPKYWARTSPVLFPFVGSLRDKAYRLDGKVYPMTQHGFARDNEFTLVEQGDSFAAFSLCETEETLKNYPFAFELTIRYTLLDNRIRIGWQVENKNDRVMSFSIGAHPAFNLREGVNYFRFDTRSDIVCNLLDESGLLDKNRIHTLKNNGYVRITNDMFDNDALIAENRQAKEIALCDENKNPYVIVRFDTELFGLWSPAKKNAPFVCIEPWYGRCDSIGFCGELSEREHTISLDAHGNFSASYEIEFL